MPRQINKPVLFGILAAGLVVLLAGGYWAFVRVSRTRQIEMHHKKLETARREGDTKAELLELQILRMREPDNMQVREDYARLLEELGEYGKALGELRLLVDRDPENLSARLKLAEYALMRGDYSEVARQAGYVIARDVDNARARLLMAMSYLGRKLFAEA